MSALLILACIVAGAFLYRWRGGGYKALQFGLHVDRIYKILVIAAGVILPAAIVYPVLPDMAAVYGLVVLALSLGHAAFQDQGRVQPERPHDRIGAYQEEPDHGWLLRKLIPAGTVFGSRRRYEMLAMSFTGLVVVKWPAVVLYATGHWDAAAVMVACAALKGPGYALGWALSEWRWEWFRDPVALGESFFGAALGAGVGGALLLTGAA